ASARRPRDARRAARGGRRPRRPRPPRARTSCWPRETSRLARSRSRSARGGAPPELLTAIAEATADEVRHELSWRIGAFLEPRLAPIERHLVAPARAAALRALRGAAAMPLEAELTRQLGVPAPEVATAIVHQLEQALAA